MRLNADRTPVRGRALLATDIAGVVRVLATDHPAIAFDAEQIGTDADEIGLVGARQVPHEALILWEGESRLDYEAWDAPYPTEVVYTGEWRLVQPGELLDLYRMRAPWPPDADPERED